MIRPLWLLLSRRDSRCFGAGSFWSCGPPLSEIPWPRSRLIRTRTRQELQHLRSPPDSTYRARRHAAGLRPAFLGSRHRPKAGLLCVDQEAQTQFDVRAPLDHRGESDIDISVLPPNCPPTRAGIFHLGYMGRRHDLHPLGGFISRGSG